MIRVAVVGCGLIGRRRAAEIHRHPASSLGLVVDIHPPAAAALAEEFDCPTATDWHQVLEDPSLGVVVVSTHNGLLAEITTAALAAGKHVLVEKPMGRNLAEAQAMAAAATNRVLKIGFNHRYHPALARAHQLYRQGLVGELINLRAYYGHGGRPGYEREWRGDPVLAGGGELTDQGVHIVDLIHWFAGLPQEAFAYLQTVVWPIEPLEDNGFGLFRYPNGVVANFHTSWTQWKNLFSFEVFGREGSLSVSGLGRSYGIERLVIARRRPEGGVPDLTEEVFDQPDSSWRLEWEEFIAAITQGEVYQGTPAEGLAAMRMLQALYQAARTGAVARV